MHENNAYCFLLRVVNLLFLFIMVEFEDTVEPPWATTSRRQPPPISDRQSKTPKFSQTKPYSRNL